MKKIFIAAGGTAGHINAAKALGEHYSQNSFEVNYITGTRHLDYKLFTNEKAIYLDGKPLRSSNPVAITKSLFKNFQTFFQIINVFKSVKPEFIIGCGGYVCGPSLVAGWILRIPVFILEQNAVMGLTNKLLSFFAKKIFTNFRATKNISKLISKKIVVVGNPVRSSIKLSTKNWSEDKIKLFVFGGSLGASQINHAIEKLATYQYPCLVEVEHQTGLNYKPNQRIESGLRFKYTAYEYIDDIQKKYDWCHALVTRAGASTISELRIVQKPVIIIPYPQATDNHQYYNAKELASEVSFPVSILDHNKTPEILAQEIYAQLIDWYRNRLVMDYVQKNKVDDVVGIIQLEINKCLE